jgi:superoxide reductase
MKFYKNESQILLDIYNKDNIENLKVLVPNTHDGASEKHVPVVKIDNNKVFVNVGEIDHPMIDVHYIVMIAIETSEGYYVKNLKPGDKPCAEFVLNNNERFVKAYEYCNLHSLWSN